MKKLLSLMLSALCLLTAASAFAQESAPETVVIQALNGNRESIELTVPYDPQRIAILDMASLDILMALGLEDRVVGSASSSLEYVQSVVTAEGVANLGTIKTADMEAVMACEPDIIFIGGRLSGSYDTLSEIAPVVYLPTTDEGTLAQTRLNADTIASIFGKEAMAKPQSSVW